MEPRIEKVKEKRLVGKRLKMSFAEDKTAELWRSFMPGRKEIGNTVSADLYSLQVFDPSFFDHFNPEREFEKWALVEVTHFDGIPDGMVAFTIPVGLYAVFHYKGSSTDTKIFDYIFRTLVAGFRLRVRQQTSLCRNGRKI